MGSKKTTPKPYSSMSIEELSKLDENTQRGIITKAQLNQFSLLKSIKDNVTFFAVVLIIFLIISGISLIATISDSL